MQRTQISRKSGLFLCKLCFRKIQRGRILLLAEERVQLHIDCAFDASRLGSSREFQIHGAEQQVWVSEKHDLAVLHGAGRDRDLNGAVVWVMQRDMPGERSASLHQENFSHAVPAAAV